MITRTLGWWARAAGPIRKVKELEKEQTLKSGLFELGKLNHLSGS